jgi:hypothetical protein
MRQFTHASFVPTEKHRTGKDQKGTVVIFWDDPSEQQQYRGVSRKNYFKWQRGGYLVKDCPDEIVEQIKEGK